MALGVQAVHDESAAASAGPAGRVAPVARAKAGRARRAPGSRGGTTLVDIEPDTSDLAGSGRPARSPVGPRGRAAAPAAGGPPRAAGAGRARRRRGVRRLRSRTSAAGCRRTGGLGGGRRRRPAVVAFKPPRWSHRDFSAACWRELNARPDAGLSEVDWLAVIVQVLPPDLEAAMDRRLRSLPSYHAINTLLASAGIEPVVARGSDFSPLGAWAADLCYTTLAVRLRSCRPPRAWISSGLGGLSAYYPAAPTEWECGPARFGRLLGSYLSLVLLVGDYDRLWSVVRALWELYHGRGTLPYARPRSP